MKKRVIAGLFALIATLTVTTTQAAVPPENRLDAYHELGFESSVVEVWKAEDLTTDYLVNRDGKIIIEEIIGVCLNENGDGKVLGIDGECNYISYKGVDGVHAGDIVCTYCVYNNENNAEDDIVLRTDVVILAAE